MFYNVAVVGATGMVGNKFLEVLAERNFPIKNLYLFASKRSAGKTLSFKGQDVIVEELKAVNDPKGGYWKKGQYIPSIVAEIAQVIEEHFIQLGLIAAIEKPQKIKELNVKELPAMRICPKCNMPTLTREAGCDKCLSCSWSRCG